MTDRQNQKLEQLLANTGDIALKRRARRIIQEIDPKPGDKILDVGCGDGYYLYLLSNLGVRLSLVGTDLDSAGMASGKKNLKGKRIRFIEADLMKPLPFKKNYFDKVVMSEVAEHLPNDLTGLKNVQKSLKPGGVLCLSVPNKNYPLLWDPVNWFLERITGRHIVSGFWAGLWNQHLRLYTPIQISDVVRRAGFKISCLESLTFWSLPFNHNLINFGARRLHGGALSKADSDAINKFKPAKSRPWYIELFFRVSQAIDSLNDIWTPSPDWGVGVFIKAIK